MPPLGTRDDEKRSTPSDFIFRIGYFKGSLSARAPRESPDEAGSSGAGAGRRVIGRLTPAPALRCAPVRYGPLRGCGCAGGEPPVDPASSGDPRLR